MRRLRLCFTGSLAGVALALGACGDDSGAHRVVRDAGLGSAAGAAGAGGEAVLGEAGACPEVTPASVGCKARYDDQIKESALTYGACGSYQAWLNSGPPAVVCIYDMTGDLVYWRSCGDVPVTCGTGSGNACHANGLDAPNGPPCFLPAPMRPDPPGTGAGTSSDAGAHEASGSDASSASADDAGRSDGG
jgi:hypothetical protein